jgi:hypothetical protein
MAMLSRRVFGWSRGTYVRYLFSLTAALWRIDTQKNLRKATAELFRA